jgi:mannose-6-phosphate isomerase-like protein (cupin superfamily)
MSEQLKQIARRLKKIREENELTLEWAAAALEVSPQELASYESGEEDIPVSFLYMAAKKYGVELSEVLTGEEPRDQVYTLVRKGEGISVERQKAYTYQSLCAEFAHKKIEPLLVSIEAKPDDEPLHYNTHLGQEFHYVLSGRLEVMLEDESIILEPGDSLMSKSEHRHALRALNEETAQVLVVIV